MRRDSGARSHAARNARCIGSVGISRIPHVARGTLRVACRARWGRLAGAFAERAARCTRAQGNGYSCCSNGGVISSNRGATLFDGVAISGTEAEVRAGGQRCVSGPMRVGGAGGGFGRRGRGAWLYFAQYGGVVTMYDGAVTFKGGTITNTKATVRIGRDAPSHTGTGCRMLLGLRRAVCGARCMGIRDSMVRSSCVVSAAGRMPRLGMRPGSVRHLACRCTLCCIAWYGAPLPTVRC
jgi:hypothetical protein